MSMLKQLFFYGILIQLAACHAKDVYETTQQNQQRYCDRMPEGSQRDDCLAEIGPGYHEYERQRKELEQGNEQ